MLVLPNGYSQSDTTLVVRTGTDASGLTEKSYGAARISQRGRLCVCHVERCTGLFTASTVINEHSTTSIW